ncbi:MAG: hypothetical protein KDB29_10885 [Planctomycetes bacterium]|nr:hypothetical protein [Planctomycetota bacterium]
MRKTLIAFAATALLLSTFGVTQAETVYLKSGSKIVGKVLEDSAEKVRIEVEVEGGGKAVMSIDKSRIDRIEDATTFDERIKAAEDLLVLENFRAAEADFRELVRDEPKDARCRLGLAKALVGIYKYEEAVKTLEHYLLLVNQDRSSDLMLYLAEQYLHARNYRDAKKTAREAGDLYPMDKGLQATVADFLKRCDRVKSGAEQLKERETAESAERKDRIAQRKEWDEEKGNSFESVEFGQELADWTAESNPKLLLGRYLELGAERSVWNTYLAGGEPDQLQRSITRVELKMVVDETRWLEMYDHQKATLIYGWYYQLRGRYSKTFPSVTVVCVEKENGKDKEKKLSRGSWDGRRDEIIIDRFTKENRDPGRPVKRIVK